VPDPTCEERACEHQIGMPINMHKPEAVWLDDYQQSVNLWNSWYMANASKIQTELRQHSKGVGEELLVRTDNLTKITADVLRIPRMLEALRMAGSPAMARDRLAGLAGVDPAIVRNLEMGRLSKRRHEVDAAIARLLPVLQRSIDAMLAPWLAERRDPTQSERELFLAVLGDRMTQARVDPILRNKQEERQLNAAASLLAERGYTEERPKDGTLREMEPGTFCRRLTITANGVRIPVDLVIQPFGAQRGDVPILIEAKSAGDDTNTNKRRKEEANKYDNLKAELGDPRYYLLLGGYFPVTYLRYNREQGIDWMWEHKLKEDMTAAGLL